MKIQNKLVQRLGLCICNLPARFILTIFGFFAIINAYTMRSVLNLTITQMVLKVSKPASNFTGDGMTCIENDGNAVEGHAGFDWSEEYQGVILGAFYWLYGITHVPGGILSTKYGGKYTLSLGILSTAIFTLITPTVINWGGGNWLIAMRALEGLFEGTTFPATNTLLAAWIPRHERARASALVYGGAQIGNIAAHSLSGLLLDNFEGWSSPFYFFGTCGLIWFVLFQLLCYKDPESHPFISEKEKDYLRREMKQLSRDKSLPPTPFYAILTSVPVIALVITQFGHGFGYFTVVTDLPKYMNDVLHYNVRDNGLLSSLPYLAMWISSMIFGLVSDKLIAHGKISLTNSRKLNTTFAFTFPGLFLVAASYSGCNGTVAVTMFTIAMGFMGAYYSGMKANVLDLAPNYAGTIMALSNGIGSIPGVVAPYIVGVLTGDKTVQQWRTVFFISCGMLMITNLVFVIWGTGDTQPWNDLRTMHDKTNNGAIENGGEEKKRKSISDFDAEIDNNDDEKSTKL